MQLRNKKRTLILLASAGVLLLTIALFYGWKEQDNLLILMESCREWLILTLNKLPPLIFFAIMSLAPAAGVPVSPFFLISPGYGLVTALIGNLTAMTLNMAITYWLARTVLRPLIEKLIRKMNREVPEISGKNQIRMAIIIRLTPGFPFFVQNYVLGLSGMSFPVYLMVSCLLNWPLTIAFTLMGNSLFSGHLGTALIGLFLLIIIIIAISMIRDRLDRKNAKQPTI